MAGAHRRDLLRRPGHLPRDPADRRDQLGHRVLGGLPIRQDRRIHRAAPPALQDPGLLHDLAHRVVDPVRALRLRDPVPPVHQRGGIKPLVIDRQPASHLPPNIEPDRLGGLPVRIIMQGLQRQDRGHPGGRQRWPAHPQRREQVRIIGVGEHDRPGSCQEREHAPRRDQVPGQHLSVQKLPVHPLETLHGTIIPGHRTPSRQTLHGLRPFQQAPREASPRTAEFRGSGLA
jgi:hypothetical protein